MRAASRWFFDCGLDELGHFFRLVRLGGESAGTSGKRVDDSNLMVERFNRVSQVLGRMVETFNRVFALFNRAANL